MRRERMVTCVRRKRAEFVEIHRCGIDMVTHYSSVLKTTVVPGIHPCVGNCAAGFVSERWCFSTLSHVNLLRRSFCLDIGLAIVARSLIFAGALLT